MVLSAYYVCVRGYMCEQVLQLEEAAEARQEVIAGLEKKLYDKEMEVQVMHSDLLLLRQDLQQRELECENIHMALQQMQRERDTETRRLEEAFEARLQAALKQSAAKVEEVEAIHLVKLEEEKEQREQLQVMR